MTVEPSTSSHYRPHKIREASGGSDLGIRGHARRPLLPMKIVGPPAEAADHLVDLQGIRSAIRY